jgi:hypothetical protein
MSQITHDTAGKQIVSAETLRKVLRETADDLSRPRDFPVGSEWRTGRESCAYCAYDTTASEHEDGCPSAPNDNHQEDA